MKHPIQPIETDAHGVARFKRNEIVCRLLMDGPFDMNTIAMGNFSNDDREQFAQLTGYSLSGFCTLSYASETTCVAAEAMHFNGADEKDARITYLEALVQSLRQGLREPIAALFEIHPDDLCAATPPDQPAEEDRRD